METGTTRTRLDLGIEERFSALRRQLGVTSFGMNLIVLQPRQRGRIHRHERQEEVYLVLEGTLTLVIEGDEERELGPGELARVAPDVRRQLINLRDEPLRIIAVGGATPHEGRDGRAYESWEETGEGRTPQDVPLPENVSVRP
jgi:mannose-6-phosphate isomerase-like protein (cupin superfamily)